MDRERNPSVVMMENLEKNPYISLLTDALTEAGVSVIHGDRPIILPLTRSAFSHPESDVIQLDWLKFYYMTDGFTEYKIIDDLITIARAITFIIDLLIVSKSQTALVWTVHNKRHHEKKYPRTERLVKEIAYWTSDAISVKCDNAKDELTDQYSCSDPEKMYIVPDGNYISAYDNTVSRAKARSELGIEEETFVFLFFGLIREYKGIPELLKAYSSTNLGNSKLLIVGNPETEGIRENISQHSKKIDGVQTVFGFIEENRIQIYMNAADCLVLPYQDVLNSGSVHLGTSFGLPIIAPKMGCIPEVLPPENDFLYNSTKNGDLSDELENAYRCSPLDAVREANRQKAETQTWEKTANKLKSIYNHVSDRN